MSRIKGQVSTKASKITESHLNFYISRETERYLKRLYYIEKRGHSGKYSWSGFLRMVIGNYVSNNWGILEKIEEAIRNEVMGIPAMKELEEKGKS